MADNPTNNPGMTDSPTWQMNKVMPLWFWCQKILPMTIDDSLSYYEALCRVRAKLNEVINTLNTYSDNLKAYVDQQDQAIYDRIEAQVQDDLAKIRAEMAALDARLTNSMDEFDQRITAQIEAQNAYVQQQIAKLTAEINQTVAEVYGRLNDTLTSAKAYTDFRIEEVLNSLPDLTTIYVHNPVTGEVSTMQDCVDDMYNALRYMALTAWGYDSLGLTAQEYDEREIFAWVYDRWSWYLFDEVFPWHKTFSGNTGEYITIKQAIRELWANDRTSGLTAQDFDSQEQTAGAFDALDQTAYKFDWAPATI